MTTIQAIYKDLNKRFEQLKEAACEDKVGEDNFLLMAAMGDGPIHTASLAPDVFFNGVMFNAQFWPDEARRMFSEDPVPTILGVSVPIKIVKGVDDAGEPIITDCIGIACIHRFCFRTGAYIMVGDEYMWEDNFNTELLRPFFAPLHAQLAQYG